MIQNITGTFSVQIVVTVVRHADQCILIRNCFVCNRESRLIVLTGNLVGDRHGQCSWESLIHMRAFQRKCNGGICFSCYVPDPFWVRVRTAVKIIFSIVGSQFIFCTIQCKWSTSDTIGASADIISKAGVIGHIACKIIIAKDNIRWLAILIRDEQAYESAAVICDRKFDGVIF